MPHSGVYETGLKVNWLLIEQTTACERKSKSVSSRCHFYKLSVLISNYEVWTTVKPFLQPIYTVDFRFSQKIIILSYDLFVREVFNKAVINMLILLMTYSGKIL